MSKITDYIMEKVSKTEIDEALKNPNIRIGCEFEFLGDSSMVLQDSDSDEENPWPEWIEQAKKHNKLMMDYVTKLEAFDEKLEKWRNTIKTQNTLFEPDPEPLMPLPPNTQIEYGLDGRLWILRDRDYYRIHDIQIFDMELVKLELEEWRPPQPNKDEQREEMFRIFRKKLSLPASWGYQEDGSLKGTGDYTIDCEIATEPMTLPDFLNIVPKVFELIDEYGQVNNKCGFHIGMSLYNVPDLEESLDVVKLAMFTDEEYIFKFFSERKDNTYVLSSHNEILSSYIVTPDSFSKLIDTGKLGREYSKTHYNAINHEHLVENNKYIEFRYMGGEDYHKKWDKIKTIVAQYAYNMVLACDPNYKKKEYLLKIQRIINKIDYMAKQNLLGYMEDELENGYSDLNRSKKQQQYLTLETRKMSKILKSFVGKITLENDDRLDTPAVRMAQGWWDDMKIELAGMGDKIKDGKDIVAEYFALKEFFTRWRYNITFRISAQDYFWKMNKRREDIERYGRIPRSIPYDSRGEMDRIYDKMDNEMKKLVAESTKLQDALLTEKVSKRDVDIALSNKNVRIGFEIEMIVPTFNVKYGKAAKMWVEWDRYNQRYEAWESSEEEYIGAGNEEGYDPPDVPEWARELGYESGEDELPNPTELFEMPELDIEKFFDIVIAEFLPLDKLPFTNMIIDHDNTRKSTTDWVIKPDATLGPAGVEIVSPILTIDQYLEMCPKMFDYVEKYGTTDDSCGFHISISLKNVPDLSKSLDVVKMALFLEEDYIYNFFKKRRDNDYARSAHRAVRVNLRGNDVEEFIKNNIDIQKLKKAIPDTHYEAINIEHLTDTPHKQYIEFRYLGSGDYHKKWKEIKTITAHYIWALSVGNDPEYMKKEYLLKMNRLLLKYQMFTLKKELVIMVGNKTDDSPKYGAIEKEIKKLESMGIKLSKEDMIHFDPDTFDREHPIEHEEK